MMSPGKELLENSEQREARGLGGRGYTGGSPVLSPAASAPLPRFSPPAPGSVHCPLRPPAPPHSMKPCPLHSLHTAGPRGTGSEPPHTHMHARAHTYTHMVDTTQVHRAAAPAPPRTQYCPWHSGPSRHLKLPGPGWGPAPRPPLSWASLHSRHRLKENGGRCPPGGPLEGSARLPVWLS